MCLKSKCGAVTVLKFTAFLNSEKVAIKSRCKLILLTVGSAITLYSK